MSVWRNEEDFMENIDNKLSEFYIKDKKPNTVKKLNVHTQKHKQSKSWIDDETDSEDDATAKSNNTAKCPNSMEPIDTLQMMESIRTQVRKVVGDRYHNDSIEKYYKVDQEPDTPSTSNQVSELESALVQLRVDESASNSDSSSKYSSSTFVNDKKTDVTESVASTSKSNGRGKSNMGGKSNNTNNNNNIKGRGRVVTRYHNNIAFSSLQSKSKDPYNHKSTVDFPPL